MSFKLFHRTILILALSPLLTAIGETHTTGASEIANETINCQSLRETLSHPRWLTLPMSRLVVHPTYTYAHGPVSPSIGDDLRVDMAYYVGAEPARLPGFLSWQLDPDATATGQEVSLAQADWQLGEVTADFTQGQVRLASTGAYGNINRNVTVNLDRTPTLVVQVPRTDGQWAVKVSDGAPDIPLIADTGQTGEQLVDVPAKTGWHGTRTFTLKVWAVGGPGHGTTLSDLRFLPPLSAPGPREYTWEPHQILTRASSVDGTVRVETTTALSDEDTLSQRLHVLKAGTGRLRLTGQFTEGSIQWDWVHGALLLHGNGYHAALAFSRPVRWLGVRRSSLDWRLQDAESTVQIDSGVWGVELDELKPGDEVVASARFMPTPGGVEQTRKAAESGASPAAFAAALRRQEAGWNGRLALVPRPLDFMPRAADPKGVMAEDVRRSYYRAWVFLYSDTLPPMPENGFSYPQVCAGKPSLWMEGAPHSEETALWDSLYAMQGLALVEPDTAWTAAAGIMSQVGPDGYIAGEALPTVYAQTFWLLYQQTGRLNQLRTVYPALKRYLLWKIAHPRWIFPNKLLADVKPNATKDNEFLVHEIVEMGYAIKIAKALGLPAEVAFWTQQQQMEAADYQRWFWPAPGNVLYRVYVSDQDRGGPEETWSLKGLLIDQDLLPQSDRDHMIALFRQHFQPDMPFGIRENRFGDLEPITLGLFRSGQPALARIMADVALRDVTRAGDFSEDYTRTDPPAPDGVRPSSFGARLMIDSVLWHNGIVLDEGLPVLIGMPGAAGVDNIPVHGRPISVHFDQVAHTVTLQGSGLKRLRLPEGFHASGMHGRDLLWTGPIAKGQEIRLGGSVQSH